MRRTEDFEDHPWLILPAVPGAERKFKRWNVWLISALVFLVVGVFIMTMTPELGHATAKMHNVPTGTSAQHHARTSHQAHN